MVIEKHNHESTLFVFLHDDPVTEDLFRLNALGYFSIYVEGDVEASIIGGYECGKRKSLVAPPRPHRPASSE